MIEMIERIIGNARRLGIDAFHTAAALDLVAPQPGCHWLAICCWCFEERADQNALIYRVNDATAGWCQCCPYAGRDTLVAAIRKQD